MSIVAPPAEVECTPDYTLIPLTDLRAWELATRVWWSHIKNYHWFVARMLQEYPHGYCDPKRGVCIQRIDRALPYPTGPAPFKRPDDATCS